MTDLSNESELWQRDEPTGKIPRFIGVVLRRRWFLVVGLAAVGFAAGVVYGKLAQPTYFSQALVTLNLSRTAQLRGDAYGPIIDKISSDLVATHVTAITAEPLLRRVVDQLGPARFERPSLRGRVFEWLGFASSEPSNDPAERTDKALAVLQKRLDVSRSGDSYVISIGFEWSDATEAAEVANAVANAYLDEQKRVAETYSGQRIAWLQANLDQARKQLADASERIIRYKAEQHIVTVDGQPVDDGELKTAAGTLNDAELKLVQAQATLADLNAAIAAGTPLAAIKDVIDAGVMKDLREKYQQALTLRNEIVARVGTTHGAAVIANSTVTGLGEQIMAELKRTAQGYRSDIAIATQTREAARANLLSLFTASQDSRRRLLPLLDLQATERAQKALVEDLSARLARARVNADFPIRDIEFTQRAIPIEVKLGPKTGRLAIAGTAGGVLASFIIIGAGLILNGRIRTRRQIEALLGLPCFGYAPHVEADAVVIRPSRAAFNRDLLLAPPFSLFSEALKAAYLRHVSADGGRDLVIGVVAASAGEGTTTVAANLALLAASSGARCLLVDGDSRGAVLSRSATWPIRGGSFLDVLAGRTALAEAVIRIDDNLVLLPADPGATAQGTLDALSTAQMAEAFMAMRANYDVIVLDLPPLAQLVDAAVLAPFVDGFVLVVDGETARARVLQRALRERYQVAEKCTGTILNKVDVGRLEFYGESVSGYYSGGYLPN